MVRGWRAHAQENLLIEEDRKAASRLSRGLREEGFVVDVAYSTDEGDQQRAGVDHDLIVRHWMLPDNDGAPSCAATCARGVTQTPILICATQGES